MTRQRDGVIHSRYGGGRCARLARESASMELFEKKCGATCEQQGVNSRA